MSRGGCRNGSKGQRVRSREHGAQNKPKVGSPSKVSDNGSRGRGWFLVSGSAVIRRRSAVAKSCVASDIGVRKKHCCFALGARNFLGGEHETAIRLSDIFRSGNGATPSGLLRPHAAGLPRCRFSLWHGAIFLRRLLA